MAAPEFRYGLEVQQTSVQKQSHLLCLFPFQFSLETINCLCRHRIIIQHIPLGLWFTKGPVPETGTFATC